MSMDIEQIKYDINQIRVGPWIQPAARENVDRVIAHCEALLNNKATEESAELLLEALRGLLSVCKAEHGTCWYKAHQERAREAIEKATGEGT